MEEAGRRESAGMQVQGFAIPGSITGQATRYHQQRAMARILSHRDLNKRTTLTAGTDATAGHLIDSELRPENLNRVALRRIRGVEGSDLVDER